MIKNFYKILGVDYEAGDQEIRNAYRALAKKYHPDLNQGDESAGAKFRSISQAQDTLLDPELRQEHDVLLLSKGVIMPHIEKLKQQEAEEKAKEAQERKVAKESGQTIVKPKEKPKPPPKKSIKDMTKAERNAEAMRRVRESKRFTKKVILISSIASGIFVIALIVTLILINTLPYATVTFNFNYNNETLKKSVEKGQYITAPEAEEYPEYEGYTFDAWYIDEGLTSVWKFSEYTVNMDMTLYAKWEEIPDEEYVTITLEYNGATTQNLPESVDVEKNSYDPLGISVAKTGYKFAGWCSDEKLTTVLISNSITGSPPAPGWTEDMTLYAKWEVVSYTITIDLGTEYEYLHINYGTEAENLIYIHSIDCIGFFDAETGGNMILDEDGYLVEDWFYTQDMTLYPQYSDDVG